MWFVFPKGVECISVERQEFRAEANDVSGRACFRAPAHFAPRILAIGGFALAGDLVEGSIGDLVPEDPSQEAALATLVANLTAREDEVRGLREDLAVLKQELVALQGTHDATVQELESARAMIEELQEQAEDTPQAKPKK